LNASRTLAVVVALVGLAASSGVACRGQFSELGAGGAIDPELLAPQRSSFEPVADAMQPHCGTLDCHGQIGRNMRLFGARGLRLRTGANPADDATTPAEYDATFWSVVGLEPEALTEVLADGGAWPERLSLIRKARGHERHKGNTLMSPGDDLDTCLTSWLAGPVAAARCRVAASVGAPGATPNP
jgi:hypothetical protein